MTEERRPALISSLTGIRGIACLSIVCFHFFCLYVDDLGLNASALPFFPASEFFFTYSKNAVELFFMISGFLTAHHYRDKIASMPAWDYFKRRYGKLIVPSVIVNLWALGNALVTLRTVPGSEGFVSPITPLRIVLSVLMVNTGWFTSSDQTGLPINSTMWFIDVLLLCYLLYYPIRRLARSRAPYVVLCLAMVVLGWVCLERTPNLKHRRHWSFTLMPCCPTRSCCSFSRWLLGGILKSRKSAAASIIWSFLYTMRRSLEGIPLGGLAPGSSQVASSQKEFDEQAFGTFRSFLTTIAGGGAIELYRRD